MLKHEDLIKYMVAARTTATDEAALAAISLYPSWKVEKNEDGTETGIPLAAGDRVQHGGILYRVKEGKGHITQSDWAPDVATSVFEVVDVGHKGTLADPIPYSVNMEVYQDKYYTYEGVLYICTRDSDIALQHTPAELIGHYFELA